MQEDGKMLTIDLLEKNDITIIHLTGILDIATTNQLRDKIDNMVQNNTVKTIFNLGNLKLIDSTGVGAIVSLFKRLRTKGGDVKISNLNGQPKEIFHLLGLQKAFQVFASVEEALESFS
jgi:anti-sigma B factor antagonist